MKSIGLRIVLLAFLLSVEFVYSITIEGLSIFPANYFIAAAVSTCIICLLPYLGKTLLTQDLQIINLLWVVAHAYGFILYMLYLEPTSYDNIQKILLVAQFGRLIIFRGSDANYITYRERFGRFRNIHFYMP